VIATTVDLGVAAVGDPLLGAVEHVVVAVAPRGGLHAPGVAAGAGLGEGEGPEPTPGSHVGEVLRFLRLGAEEDNRDRPEGGGRVGDGHAGAAARELLHAQAQVEDAAAEPAVGLGDPDREEVGRRAGLDHLPGKLLLLVELRADGDDLLPGDLPRGLADHLLLLAQEVVHRGNLLSQG
jgi:hypothetical protein